MEYLDGEFPAPALNYCNDEADAATKDLFSKFCFFIKDVNKDAGALENELRKLDTYCRKVSSFGVEPSIT